MTAMPIQPPNRVCSSCGDTAYDKRCGNDHPAHWLNPKATHDPLTWHSHDYDEWWCRDCADGYGEEFFVDDEMRAVIDTDEA